MNGLVTWLAAGLVAGTAARLWLPGPPVEWPSALGVGIAGALLGGLLATAIGMGGIAELEPRSAILALLAAALSLIGVQVVRVARRRPSR